jgi:hypothetical protein
MKDANNHLDKEHVSTTTNAEGISEPHSARRIESQVPEVGESEAFEQRVLSAEGEKLARKQACFRIDSQLPDITVFNNAETGLIEQRLNPAHGQPLAERGVVVEGRRCTLASLVSASKCIKNLVAHAFVDSGHVFGWPNACAQTKQHAKKAKGEVC